MTFLCWLRERGACDKAQWFVHRNYRLDEEEATLDQALKRAWQVDWIEWLLGRMDFAVANDVSIKCQLAEMRGYLWALEDCLPRTRDLTVLSPARQRLRRRFLRRYGNQLGLIMHHLLNPNS